MAGYREKSRASTSVKEWVQEEGSRSGNRGNSPKRKSNFTTRSWIKEENIDGVTEADIVAKFGGIGIGDFNAKSMVNDSNGNIIYIHNITNTNDNGSMIHIEKTDSGGYDTIWSLTIQNAAVTDKMFDPCSRAFVDSSDNLYICGFADSTTVSDQMVIFKISSSGTLLWKRAMSGTDVDDITSQSNFFHVDSSGNSYCLMNNTNTSWYIFKFDTNGTRLFRRVLTLGTWSAETYCSHMVGRTNGETIILAKRQSGATAQLLLIKLDTSGVPTLKKTMSFGAGILRSTLACGPNPSNDILVICHLDNGVIVAMIIDPNGVIQDAKKINDVTKLNSSVLFPRGAFFSEVGNINSFFVVWSVEDNSYDTKGPTPWFDYSHFEDSLIFARIQYSGG